MKMRDWDDPKLRSFDEVNKDWYKDGTIVVLSTLSARELLCRADPARFVFLRDRIVDKWNWGQRG